MCDYDLILTQGSAEKVWRTTSTRPVNELIQGPRAAVVVLASQTEEDKLDMISRAEKLLISQFLTETNSNQSETARILGLSRYQLRYRAAKYGLLPPMEEAEGRVLLEEERSEPVVNPAV